MFLKLAWKNIWRNKKRTAIVMTSIFFGVILASISRSGQIGSFDYMIHSIAKMHLGFLQVQDESYWENRSLDNSFVFEDTKLDSLASLKHITSISPRIDAYALVSKDSLTQVSLIYGINPENEDRVTHLKNRIIAGNYLNVADKGALVGSGIMEKLKLQIGDSLLIFGVGYHGQTAAALLPIRGIVKFPVKKMNKSVIYISMDNARHIFSMPSRMTSLVIMIDEIYNLNPTVAAIKPLLSNGQTVLTWEELMPEIKQMISMKTGSSFIMIGILYMVIGFGLFGVIMMMTMEREKEWGILNTLGMKKIHMIIVSGYESILIAILGTIIGIAGAYPIAWYLHRNPIRVVNKEIAKSWEQLGLEPVYTFSDNPEVFLYQALIVFIMALVCLGYPVLFLGRLDIVKAMRK